MKQKQCDLKDSYKPSAQDIIENRKKYEICRYYGIRIEYFSSKDILTKDELKALSFINKKQNIPDDLANRLLATKSERVNQLNTVETNQATEKDVEELFGIKIV